MAEIIGPVTPEEWFNSELGDYGMYARFDHNGKIITLEYLPEASESDKTPDDNYREKLNKLRQELKSWADEAGYELKEVEFRNQESFN